MCSWWLNWKVDRLYTAPYQPDDTRITIYNQALAASLFGGRVAQYMTYFKGLLRLRGALKYAADIDLALPAVDIMLLNAVCNSPNRA